MPTDHTDHTARIEELRQRLEAPQLPPELAARLRAELERLTRAQARAEVRVTLDIAEIRVPH